MLVLLKSFSVISNKIFKIRKSRLFHVSPNEMDHCILHQIGISMVNRYSIDTTDIRTKEIPNVTVRRKRNFASAFRNITQCEYQRDKLRTFKLLPTINVVIHFSESSCNLYISFAVCPRSPVVVDKKARLEFLPAFLGLWFDSQ